MLLRFGKQYAKDKETLDDGRDIAEDVTEADFIPYAFHLDPHTLLTKNGELLHIFRISTNRLGVDFESPEPGIPALRDAIRDAITGTVEHKHFAYWFHTIRRRSPISHTPSFTEPFAGALHAAWQAQHQWRHSYGNEVYISLLRQGQAADLFDAKEIAKGFLPSSNRKHRDQYIDHIKQELDGLSERIVAQLSAHCNIRRLTLAERAQEDGSHALFSEPLELLYYLINLQQAPMPLQDVDASRALSGNELTFGFDAMESRNADGKRRFAGILTLKGTQELSTSVLDKCLQLPEELIITQSFNYIPRKQALEKRLATKDILDASQDPLIAHISGLSAIIGADKGSVTDYGEQHTSIAVIRDQYKLLDQSIGEVQDSFAKLGLISVREEIMLEDCYWAQLPGNFSFLRRRAPIAAKRLAGLARLNHFPSGKSEGNHWGAPLAILPTTMHTPYFFNFHHGATGHTAMLDFNSFADERGSSLLNFLLAGSRQYGGKLLILDRNYTAKPLVQALGGHYYQPLGAHADASTKPCGLNPLQLEDTRRNRAFLAAWLSHFLKPEAAHEDTSRDVLKAVLEQLYALPQELRTLARAKAFISEQNEALLAPENPHLTAIFSAGADTIDFSGGVSGVEMLDVVQHKELRIPVFSYLLHRIVLALDGSPTVIVINEAWDLLNNDFFAPRLVSLLSMLEQHNAMMVFTTRSFEDHADSHLTKLILEHAPTKLFIPDDIATDYFPEATGLTAHEIRTLTFMERQKGQFLVKHGQEVVECEFPQEGLEKYAKTLAGDAKALRLMQIQQR